MKFNFENFGYVDKGSLQLGELTLICGPNNVGKTYISYGIYGFIRFFKKLVQLDISLDKIKLLREKGTLIIDLQEYQQKLPNLLKKTSEKYTENLVQYFNVSDDFFSNSKIEFVYDNYQISFNREFQQIIKFGTNETLIFDKSEDETTLSIALTITEENNIPNRILREVIENAITDYLFVEILPKPFIVTSERTGIALFYKELDISKNNILKHLSETDNPDPISLIKSMQSRYAHPIQDNIDIIRDYDKWSKNKSFIREDKITYKPILDALNDILGGSFKLINQLVMYCPKKERNRDKISLPVYIASSAIKSLFLIDLYINCLAEKQGLLIIDEPELNLHPDNQGKMAGLLARLVNAGVKVLITTHSDYLIREINNRIMLNNSIKNKEKLMRNAKMVQEDILRPEQVKAFSLKDNHIINEVKVDRFGIDMKIFDDLIASANQLTDNIYYNIEDL